MHLSSPRLFRGLGWKLKEPWAEQVAPGEHKVMVSEEGLGPAHLGKPPAGFLVCQAPARGSRVVPAQGRAEKG